MKATKRSFWWNISHERPRHLRRPVAITTPLARAWQAAIDADCAVQAGYDASTDEYERDRREAALRGARQALSHALLQQDITARMAAQIGGVL